MGSVEGPHKMIGEPNECDILFENKNCKALIDTGSMVTTVSSAFVETYLPKHQLHKLDELQLEGPSGETLPYSGYVEVDISFVSNGAFKQVGSFPVLVVPETTYNKNVPVLIGTNVLNVFQDELQEEFGERFLQKASLDTSVHLAIRSLHLRRKHLCQSKGEYAHARCSQSVTLEPGKSQIVCGRVRVLVPISSCIALIEGSKTLPEGIVVTPGIIQLDNDTRGVPVEFTNTNKKKVTIQSNSVIASIQQADVEDKNAKISQDEFQKLFNMDFQARVTPDQAKRIKASLWTWKDIFSLNDEDLGHTDVDKHKIKLTDDAPFHERPRRIPPALYEEVRKHLKQMLQAGVIKESTSPWASNIVIVRKPDGKIRFCIDFRRLNARTVSDAYAIPRVDDILDTLKGNRWFSEIDLKSAFWQVEVEEDDKEKTAFTVGQLGFYQCERMPFGLKNSPATFQRVMEKALGDLNLKSCLIYLDNVIVYSVDVEQHIERLCEVFGKIREAGLKLNPTKCHFFQNTINTLGHVISADGIACDDKKIEAVKNWPEPTNVKELQKFLGFSGFYRKHIKDYASIARPLTDLIGTQSNKKGKSVQKEWIWGESQQKAFQDLISHLISPPVLAYPDFSQPFILRIDASKLGLGAVLYQETDGKEHVISYASRTLKKSEMNYPAHKLEFLALYWAVTKKYNDYLYGHRFTVTTDNNPLTYILTTAKLDATGHRWLADLSSFDFDIHYKPGKSNTDADALSRTPQGYISRDVFQGLCEGKDSQHCDEEWLGYARTMSVDARLQQSSMHLKSLDVDWALQQEKDSVLHRVRELLVQGKPTSSLLRNESTEVRRLLREWNHLSLLDNVLYRVCKETNTQKEQRQLILPLDYRLKAFHLLHDEGHFGRDRMVSLMKDRFFWVGMNKDIDNWIKACDRCLRAKHPHLPESAALTSIHTSQPLELVCLDFLSLERSKGGYENVLVITDHFTKYAQAIPTRNQTAKTTAKILYEDFILHYGVPQTIHSDQGKNFESSIIKELCAVMGMKKSRTTPYHPMGNGLTERFNRTLISMLSTLTEEKKVNWKDHISSLVHAYNSTRHSSTGYSPYFLMFGREPRLSVDVCLGLKGLDSNIVTETEYIKQLQDQLAYAYKLASHSQSKSSSTQKRNYDSKVRGTCLKVGDRVLVKKVAFKGKHKIEDKWEKEAYIVLEQPNQDIPVFCVQKENGSGRIRTLHRNLLFPLYLPQEGVSSRRRQSDTCPQLSTNSNADVVDTSSDSDFHFQLESGNNIHLSDDQTTAVESIENSSNQQSTDEEEEEQQQEQEEEQEEEESENEERIRRI